MSITNEIAEHLRSLHFGGNWTAVNLKSVLSNLTWREASTKVQSFHTIAALSFHINYYVKAQIEVLHGRALLAKDHLSFDHPEIKNQGQWDAFLMMLWEDAEDLVHLIEELPDTKLNAPFVDSKYGTYYRNLTGLIEHSHYHMGQISLVKSILLT